MSNFKIGKIDGIIIKDLIKNEDDRGWLMELFREDMIGDKNSPAMSYISLTYPGIIRGPHEHREQTDYFCFFGSSDFKLILWDNRKESTTFMNKLTLTIGEKNPTMVIVPPRIVHAYKNVGNKPGLIINFPNRLYAGWGKKEKVDEIRYENDMNSPFKMD